MGIDFRKRRSDQRVFTPGETDTPGEAPDNGTSPGETPFDPSTPPAPGPRRWRWRRFIFRSTVRLVAIAVLLVAGLLTAVLWFPWSLPGLSGRLRNDWFNATGLDLQFDEATLRAADGTVEILHPRLLDHADGRTLVELESLQLDFDVFGYIGGERPLVIEDVQVAGPLELDLALHNGRVDLVGAPGHALDLFRAHRAMKAASAVTSNSTTTLRSPRLALDRIDITPVTIRWLRPAPVVATDATTDSLSTGTLATSGSLPVTQRRLMAQFVDLHIEANFERSLQPRQVYLSGYLRPSADPVSLAAGHPPTARPLRLALRPDLISKQITYNLQLDAWDSLRDLPVPIPWDSSGERLEIQGSTVWDGQGGWSTSGQAQMAAVQISTPEIGTRPIGNVTANWSLLQTSGSRELAISQLQFESPVIRLQASGSASTRRPFNYALVDGALELRGAAVALLASHLHLENRLLRPEDTRVAATFAARGTLIDPLPEQLTGALDLTGVDWATKFLPEPLYGVSGRVELTSHTLRLVNVAGVLQGMPLTLDGEARGRPLHGRVDSINLNWRAGGTVQGLNQVLERQKSGGLAGMRVEGEINGAGTIRMTGPFAGGLAGAFEQANIDGVLRLARGRVAHPKLAAPLEQVNGELRLEKNVARLREVDLTWQGLPLRIEGDMRGQGVFWNRPSLRGSAKLACTLAQLPSVAQAIARLQPLANRTALRERLLNLPPATGAAELQLRFNGLLSNLAGGDWQAGLQLDDVFTSGPLGPIPGPVRIDRANLALNRTTLTIRELRGRWQQLDVALTGSLRPAGGEMRLNASGDLLAWQQQVPAALDQFRVGGKAAFEHQLRLRGMGTVAQAPDWLAALDRWRALPPAVPDSDPLARARRFAWWQLSHSGTIDLSDAEMTYYAMPARLSGLTGRLRYDDKKLWSEAPLPVDPGDGSSRGMMGTIQLIYPDAAGNGAAFNYTVEGERLLVTPWLGDWKFRKRVGPPRHRYPEDLQFDPNMPPRFAIRGLYRAREAECFNMIGTNWTCTLDTNFYKNQPNLVRWSETRGDIYGGKAEVAGQLFNHRYENTVRADKVALPDLMKARAPDTYRGQGIYSGALSGEITLGKRTGRTPPEHLRGDGRFEITGSRFVSNKIFGGLGGLLKVPIFDDITFSRIHGPITLQDNQWRSTGVTFDGPVMNIVTDGSYGPQSALNLTVRLQLLQVAGQVPLLDRALSVVNQLVGKVLRFRIGGTLGNPTVSPL